MFFCRKRKHMASLLPLFGINRIKTNSVVGLRLNWTNIDWTFWCAGPG